MLWMLTGVHINQRPAPKKKQQLHRNGHNVWYGPVSKFSLPCTFHCSRSRPHFIESDQQISIFICSSPPTSIDGVTLVSRTAIKRFTSSNSIQWIFFPDRDALNDERGRQDICNSNECGHPILRPDVAAADDLSMPSEQRHLVIIYSTSLTHFCIFCWKRSSETLRIANNLATFWMWNFYRFAWHTSIIDCLYRT